MDLETLREEIPATETCTYLNTGASGPSPRGVVDAQTEFLKRHKFEAPCDEGMYEIAETALESARGSVAEFIGADPRKIALTNSTVEGINHVSTGINWNEGDVVVKTDAEHSAGRFPWERMRELHGVEIRTLATERGRFELEAYKAAVSDARLVCMNSPTWNYGTRLPISELVEIAHEAGARVLIDAVQAPGQLALDVESWGADFVAASGHKWLLGPWGAGFLYVDDDAIEALEPKRVGYYSVEDYTAEDWAYHQDARKFELGTHAIAPYVGLEAAIEHIEAVGIGTIENRIAELTDRLKEGLGDRLLSPPDSSTGLVTFSAEEPENLVEALASQGIQIRWLPEPYACRASVHAFNTAAEMDQLLQALDGA